VNAEVRLYDRLFKTEEPGKTDDYRTDLNPASLEVVRNAKVEPSAAQVEAGTRFQFERIGYFCADRDTSPARPVFNRTVTLKDSWAKIDQKPSA
jgi:glutaminyl-tRNA synthetase